MATQIPTLATCLDRYPTLEAQRQAGKLVILAGSGISVGEQVPNYPGLIDILEQEIGTPNGLPRNGANADEYLLRLDRAPVKLRDRVKQIFTGYPKEIENDDGSKTVEFVPHQANNKHTALVSLFEKPENIKIITTNYDILLQKAVAEIYGGGTCEESVIARHGDFDRKVRTIQGIVSLHGTVQSHAEELVLTSQDFGFCYLDLGDDDKGRQSRFLSNIVKNEWYTVLIVGFGGSDPMFQYFFNTVNRADCYVITPEHEATRWESFSIKTIPFAVPTDENGNRDYCGLEDLLQEWLQIKGIIPLRQAL